LSPGGFGALARYTATGWIQRRLDSTLPWGTAMVNLTGAAVLGFLVGLGTLPEPTMRIVALGFLGGYTTFSTWMVESILPAEEGGSAGIRAGATNAVGLLAAGMIVTTLGRRR
jgi:CrcB protein